MYSEKYCNEKKIICQQVFYMIQFPRIRREDYFDKQTQYIVT